jgi:glutamate synthase (ferredoxin)
VAERVVDAWSAYRPKFVKVMPRDFKRALARLEREEAETMIE